MRPRFTQPAKMRKRVIARPVGSSVRLKCMASGNPRPDIVWLKDDRPLTEQEVGEGRQKKWTLSLRNLSPEQSGRYTCRVSNRAGEINATYKVEVIREYPLSTWTPPRAGSAFTIRTVTFWKAPLMCLLLTSDRHQQVSFISWAHG